MLDNTTSHNADSGLGTHFRVRAFLGKHGTRLEAAAQLLGGQRWSGRVRQLCADVSNGSLPLRACLGELHALLGLLKLEGVDDLASIEAQCFSDIHPADPRVFEICSLTDQLDQLLETAAQEVSRSDNTT